MPALASLHSTTFASNECFTTDTKGDRQNLVYGSLDRSSVPKYRNAGYGRLLGLPRAYRMLSTSSSKREILDESLDSSRLSRRQSLMVALPAPEEQPVQRDDTPNFDIIHQRDYVSLIAPRNHTHGSALDISDIGSQSDGASDMETLVDEDQPVLRDDSNNISTKGLALGDAYDLFRHDPKHRRLVELQTATNQRPYDATAWLELIEHYGQTLAATELVISTYKEALCHVESEHARETFLIGMMHAGSKIWDTRKQISQWKDVLRQSKSFSVLLQYLNFRQTSAISWDYEQCLDVYQQCWSKICTMQDGIAKDMYRAYLLLRLTTFMKQSGFIERAVATWQAVLEFSFFKPTIPGTHIEPTDFELFWSRESPRIGEKGAQGWHSNSGTGPPQDIDKPFLDIDVQDLFCSWATAEQNHATETVLPARTLDVVPENDPYRVVMFTDIKDFLFRPIANIGAVSQGEKLLLNAFLQFCNLPSIHGAEAAGARDWWTDPFLCHTVFAHTSAQTRAEDLPVHHQQLISFATDIRSLFAPAQDPLGAWLPTSPEQNRDDGRAGALNAWRSRVLMQLVIENPEWIELSEYVVAYRLQQDRSKKAYAKSLLKKRPDSLRLYNVYALVECRNGNFAAAEKVWSAASSMTRSSVETINVDTVLIWNTWIWECMQVGKVSRARALIVASVDIATGHDELELDKLDETTINAASRVKTERTLRSRIDLSELHANPSLAVKLTDRLAIFSYLVGTNDLSSALAVYDSALSRYANNATYVAWTEIIHQDRARLLYFHTRFCRIYRPRDMVDHMTKSTSAYPNNSLLVLLRDYYKQQCGLIDRLHGQQVNLTSFGTPQSMTGTVLPYVFSIGTELRRFEFSGSTKNSIRASFHHTIANDCPGRACVAIWKSYVLWELSLLPLTSPPGSTWARKKSTKQDQNVKDVFYASIRACPWSKDLYMLAFQEQRLRDMLGFAQLQTIYQSMLDRGLRLRVDISEQLQRLGSHGAL